MSTQQIRSIEEYFPTEPWLEQYRIAIEADESISNTGDGWGVDFAGSFIFQIEDIPLAETTIGGLPEELVAATDETVSEKSESELEELLANAPEDLRSDVEARDGAIHDRVTAAINETVLVEAPNRIRGDLKAELPETMQQLLEQLDENVVDGDTVYAYLDVYNGGCREVEVLQSLDERDYGFRITGDYDQWKKLTEGEGGVINMLMAGDLDVDGDMQKILQYSEAAVDLAEISADVDSRYVV